MAITLINSTVQAGTASGISVGPFDVAGANFIAIAHAWDANGTLSTGPVDGVNTYTALPLRAAPGNFPIQLHYCENADVSSPITVTTTGTNILSSLALFAFSGVKLSGSHDGNNDGATAGVTTSLQAGNVSPAEDNELIIAAIVVGGVSNMNIDSGFSSIGFVSASGGVNVGLAASYLIQTSLAAANPTYSWTTNSEAAMTLNTFRSSGEAGPTPVLRGRTQSNLIWR